MSFYPHPRYAQLFDKNTLAVLYVRVCVCVWGVPIINLLCNPFRICHMYVNACSELLYWVSWILLLDLLLKNNFLSPFIIDKQLQAHRSHVDTEVAPGG